MPHDRREVSVGGSEAYSLLIHHRLLSRAQKFSSRCSFTLSTMAEGKVRRGAREDNQTSAGRSRRLPRRERL